MANKQNLHRILHMLLLEHLLTVSRCPSVQKHLAPKLEVDECEEVIGVIALQRLVLCDDIFDDRPIEDASGPDLRLGKQVLKERPQVASNP